ncbi:hypothetical protein GGF31_005243 [Allomyces arbusculus]|nr:hypothetical protein GGF31_005243 [Allomyces arbusculus]
MSNPAYQGGGMQKPGGANANNPAAGSSGTPSYAMQYAHGSGVQYPAHHEFTNDLLGTRSDPNSNSVAPTTTGQIHVGGGYSMPGPRQFGDTSDRAGPTPSYAPVLVDPSSLVPAAAAHYYHPAQQQQQQQSQLQPQQPHQQSVYHSQQPSQPHSHLHHHLQQYASQPQAVGTHLAGTHGPVAYAPVDHARAAPYASDARHPRLGQAVTTDSSPRLVPASTYPISIGALQFPASTRTHAPPPPPVAPSAPISLNPTYGPYDHDDQVGLYNPGTIYPTASAPTPPGALRPIPHVPSQVAANTVDALQYSQIATTSPMVPPAAMQVLPGAPIMDANTIAAAGGIPPGYVTVPASSLIPAKKARAARACLQCRKRKIKCSGSDPCQHCADFELHCEYKEPLKRGPKAGKLNALKSSGQPVVSLFQPASVLDTHVPLTSSVTRPSTDADVDEIANNLALLVTLDANGTPRGFSNYGNSSGYHLLKGLPSNTNLDGVNVFFSQIAVQHVTMNEILRHRVWFPRRDLLELLLNVYEERVHHWWPMLSRRTLNASVAYVDRALADPANEACTAEFNRHALLIYAALAMPAGMWELQHQICVAVPYSRIMAAQGKRLLANVCSSAANHLTDAQASLLLAIFDLGIPAGNNWLTSGMGFRIALSLGLNLDQRAVMPTTSWSGLGRRGDVGGGTDAHAERRELSPELVKLAQHAPGVPSRILTFLVVFIMDRLGAAAGGRPIMVHEEDCVLDLDAIKDTDENRVKYADEQDLLLPSTSYFPYYLAWSSIVGKVLRAVNSFRYRRKQLSATLLPELHAALTQFRAGIPQELVFDPAAFHTREGGPPSTATLESAVLTMGYTQTIIYMYRPLVSMVIAAALHQNEVEGDETPPPGASPLVADDPFMHARARLRAHVVAHTTSMAPTPKSKSSSTAPTSSTLSPAPPAMYPQYVAILETCVSSIAQVFSAIRPFMHLYFSTMLHQMGSVISAGRVIVAGGGNAVLVRDALRELLVVLDRLLPTVPLALHTYHTCRVQLDQLDAVIADEGGEPATPLPALSTATDAERVAARHAKTDRALAQLMDDIAGYAREVPELAGAYVAPAQSASTAAAAADVSSGTTMPAAAARPTDMLPLPAFPHSFNDWAMQVVPDGLDLPFGAPPPPPPGSSSM